MEFKLKIRSYRIKNDLSQGQLAEKLGVDQSCVARWEKGERQPKLDDLPGIAKALKISVSDLIGSCSKFPDIYAVDRDIVLPKFPLYSSRVSAGFPSPADDYIEKKLNIHELLVKNESSTFFVRVEGNSMLDARIHSGDILVVDRSIDPKPGKIVIAVLEGELTVKRIKKENGKLFLFPENPEYKPIEISRDIDLTIWGVVTNVIHTVQ